MVLVSVIVHRSVFFFNQSIYLDQTTWIHIIIKEKAQCNLVFLSVHLLTGAFSCCNFYVYFVIFFPFVIVICILFMHVCCVFLNKV